MSYPRTYDAAPLILPYEDRWPRIADTAFVAPGAVIVGDVEIGAESSVWFNCTVRGDEQSVRIGAGTNLQDGTVVHVNSKVQGTIIGDSVTIGHMAMIHACTLEDWAYVGMSAVILDGAVVESRAMLAAGALLTPGKVVKSGELWAGRPAKFMRRIEPEEWARFSATAGNYTARGRRYRERMADLGAGETPRARIGSG
ncbi:MAG: gamma carbonic anhydrase family protein [Alphaproteobacteria bacterium]|nr:gamma carbonic anhydrase family protein [Alphaproteobacteria bacterium]